MNRFFVRLQRLLLGVIFLVCGMKDGRTQSPVAVTLLPSASPSAGEPGVTNISVTGSNFPTGTIAAASVTVTLTPAAAGKAVTTQATTLTAVGGTSKRVVFTIPASLVVNVPTPFKVTISGSTAGTPAIPFQSSNTAALTVNPAASLSSITPNNGAAGASIPVAIVGSYTNFLGGSTVANFGAGILVNSITVVDASHATVSIAIASSATPGPHAVTMTTGIEVATLVNGFTVNPAGVTPTITDFNPKSAAAGTLVTVTGTNLQPNAGTSATVTLAKQGGGTLSIPASSATAASLAFVIPAGATTGALSITVNGVSAVASVPLVVIPASNFTLMASPNSANLIQGQSAAYAINLNSTSGFNQLATLSVSGVPSGVTTTFNPPSITAGQTSVLTLTASANQPIGALNLIIVAAATVHGMPVSQSAAAQLSIQAPTTSFIGRTVVSDAFETPLGGVTISMLGKDGNGNTTGCAGSTISDGAGNFALANLPAMCAGPQLVGFSGTTVTRPAGTYAGVNLAFTFVAGQVTASPILVHLPRIDNAETFYVQQNSPTDQSYSYQTIPGLSVTAYAHTTFTLPDGTTPNPFPLAAVNVPVDRLPALKPQVPTDRKSVG